MHHAFLQHGFLASNWLILAKSGPAVAIQKGMMHGYMIVLIVICIGVDIVIVIVVVVVESLHPCILAYLHKNQYLHMSI